MKKCELCGKEFPTKGPKKYCLDCSKKVYKQQQDEWREKHKNLNEKKNQIEMTNCVICGKEIPKKSSKQRYCIKCGNLVNKERTRERAREKARERDALRKKSNRTNKKED